MIIVTREGTIVETHYFSPPGLKRHRYFIDTLEKRVPDFGTPSGILINELRSKEKENAASGIPDSRSCPDPCSDQAEQAKELNDFAEQVDTVSSKEEKKPKRKLRALKRIETLIYDDTAVKQGQLEDEAYELLNADRFYDEILPIDYDEAAPETDKTPIGKLIIYLAILFAMVGIIVLWIKLVIL